MWERVRARWPTDHGFEEWYGVPHTYDECLWFDDPWYRPGRDPGSPVLEGRKGENLREVEQLTYDVRRNIDVEFNRRAARFVEQSSQAGKPFFLYFNHSMLHFPVVPRDEYKCTSGNGDWADSLLELDGDFDELLDQIDRLGLRNNTIVVFAGDNGNEEYLLHRGTAGFWEGSLFTGMDGSRRTPCLVRWPGHVAAGRQSIEIMHVTDWFTTLLTAAGIPVPADRQIDGIDQSAFRAGEQDHSDRRIHLLERSPDIWRQVAALQVSNDRAEVHVRPRTGPAHTAHHQSAHRPPRSANRITLSTGTRGHSRTSAVFCATSRTASCESHLSRRAHHWSTSPRYEAPPSAGLTAPVTASLWMCLFGNLGYQHRGAPAGGASGRCAGFLDTRCLKAMWRRQFRLCEGVLAGCLPAIGSLAAHVAARSAAGEQVSVGVAFDFIDREHHRRWRSA